MQTNHSAMVKRYKGNLCTTLGPYGRQGRWHEVPSRFNLMIEYTDGPEDHVGDGLSRWAYLARTAQDTSFHRSDKDLIACEENENMEWHYICNELKKSYSEAFTAINGVNGWGATTLEANVH